jgi:hypothetical protein
MTDPVTAPDQQPAERPQPVAVLAPSLADATAYAQERGLERPGAPGWFYVTGLRNVLGKLPGSFIVRTVVGAPLAGDQMAAWDYMLRRGWRPW